MGQGTDSSMTIIIDADLLYGAPAIAEFLNMKQRQAYHLIDKCGLPAFKIAGKVCARKSTVTAWLAERESAAATAREQAR